MAFVTKSDLHMALTPEDLTEITRGNDGTVDQAIGQAQQLVHDYLYDSFNVEDIFAKTGTERDPLLVRYIADIAVWFLIGTIQAGVDVQAERGRYNDAVAWITMARDGQIYPQLPRREKTKEQKVFSTSKPKRNNYLL